MNSLSPRLARTFYNVADALVPPGGTEAGGGDVDLVPALLAHLTAGPPRRGRALRAALRCIEWGPILGLRSRRGFSQLPLAERIRHLQRWEESRWAPRRRALLGLRELVTALHRERIARPPGSPRGQSLGGA